VVEHRVAVLEAEVVLVPLVQMVELEMALAVMVERGLIGNH
jgi:hypothetical protein